MNPIRHFREQENLTRAELADALDLSEVYIQKLESERLPVTKAVVGAFALRYGFERARELFAATAEQAA